jgi:D-alanyl-D-alanine carboxypeptidase (penicillin-binding protein 5/6)
MRSLARRLLFCVLAAALTMGPLAGPAQARGRGHHFLHLSAFLHFPTQPKYAAIVIDAKSGEVLYEQSPDDHRYPASITKIMTMYLAFEALESGHLSLDDQIVVSPHAAAMSPSKLGVRQGQTISVNDAMSAIAVKSANDMAVAIAEKLGGSESHFAELMTAKAKRLGMNNTQFVNASGLPDNRQLTTARDIAILSRAVLRDFPKEYAFFGKHDFTWHGETIRNHNHLLTSMPGVDGIKTGFTNASGFNLAASAVRDNRRLIAVVMGGSSTAARDNHVQDLLEAGFTVLRRRDAGQVTTVAQNLREPPPVGAIERPPTEEGDGDQAGVHIVLDGKAPAKVSALADADDKACVDVRPRRHHRNRMAAVCPAPAPGAEAKAKAAPDPKLEIAKAEPPASDAAGPHLDRPQVGAQQMAQLRAAAAQAAKIAGKGRKAPAPAELAAARAPAKPPSPPAQLAQASRIQPKTPQPAKTQLASAAKAAPAKGEWAVQLGAYKNSDLAKGQLGRMQDKFGPQLAASAGSIEHADGNYRVRFAGLSADQAKGACATIKARGQDCMMFRP